MNKITYGFTLIAGLLFTGAVAAMPLGPHFKPKWSQAPDMDLGTDVLSMHRSFGPVVADDFRSNGKTIAGLHWWGSYFQDTGQGPERMTSFEISFHLDCPANTDCDGDGIDDYTYSTPLGDGYFSAIVEAEEDFYGIRATGEHVYE